MKEKDITYEVCPHCDNEVELPNTLGVHKCPHCGKYIVACSMCLAMSEGKADCENCPLCYLADKLNEGQVDDELEQVKKELFQAIGDKILPLNEIEYGGLNGVGRALSISIKNKERGVVTIGYDVNGFLFTEDREISHLIYTDFLTYVMDDIKADDDNDLYNELVNSAYRPHSLGGGNESPTIYCDEDDDISFKDLGTLLEITFKENKDIGTDVNVKYKSYLNGKILNLSTRFSTLSLETKNKLKEVVERKAKPFYFNGKAEIQINRVKGLGRTRAEALRYAKEQVDVELTRYGDFDTQINNYGYDIVL